MDTELLQEYLVESRELLDAAQENVLRLEANPTDDAALAAIFRAFHTIKGGAGYLEAPHLVAWAHTLEDLLDKLRSHALPVTSPRIDAILQGIDIIHSMFAELSEEKSPSPGPPALAATIRSFAGGDATAANYPDAPEPVIPDPHIPESDTPDQEEPAATPGKKVAAPSPPSRGAETPAAESSLRVDANRLDAVMNQVGELVLLRNRLTSAVNALTRGDENMSRIAREMDLRVSDLQNSVMRLRMQPCRRLFQQLPRVVRDVSRQLGKEIRLEIAGEDVEIDKTVVDALAGPMTHLVRNSLDHGIESPQDRRAAGKQSAGLLRIAAIHMGDKVRIEVSDDGKGIDA